MISLFYLHIKKYYIVTDFADLKAPIMEGLYKINLIPNDLSVEETVLQIADTLDNLNGIVDDVFKRISNKIKINVEKTSKLQERINISRTKVEKLAGTQKAIKVFSSAKYPSSITHEHYKSIFESNDYNYEPKNVMPTGKSNRQTNEKAIQVRTRRSHSYLHNFFLNSLKIE